MHSLYTCIGHRYVRYVRYVRYAQLFVYVLVCVGLRYTCNDVGCINVLCVVSTYVWIQGDSLKLADFTAEDHHQNEEDEEERSQTCGHNDQYLHCRQHRVS